MNHLTIVPPPVYNVTKYTVYESSAITELNAELNAADRRVGTRGDNTNERKGRMSMNKREKDLATGRSTTTETPTKLIKLQWHAPHVRTISASPTAGKPTATTEVNAQLNDGPS